MVQAFQSYSAFGGSSQPTTGGLATNSHAFAGEQLDPTGLYFDRARYYNPGLGRFTQRDSYAGLISTPLSQNRYAYGMDNPALLSDASGYSALGFGFEDCSDPIYRQRHPERCGNAPPPCNPLSNPSCISIQQPIAGTPGGTSGGSSECTKEITPLGVECIPLFQKGGGIKIPEPGIGTGTGTGGGGVDAGAIWRAIEALLAILALLDAVNCSLGSPKSGTGTQDNVDDKQATIWRLTSTDPNRSQFNWKPRSNDTDGLSGTKAGKKPFWTDVSTWIGATQNRALRPDDVVFAAPRAIIESAGFTVDDTPAPADPWHVSIGKNKIVLDNKGNASWQGNKTERAAAALQLQLLFTVQIYP